MGNNFQSLQHFLPELILIFTILFVIVADLVPSFKQYSFKLTLFGLALVGIMMLVIGPGNKLLFESMLMDDVFSFYFKLNEGSSEFNFSTIIFVISVEGLATINDFLLIIKDILFSFA